jgi:hypothetical protein
LSSSRVHAAVVIAAELMVCSSVSRGTISIGN